VFGDSLPFDQTDLPTARSAGGVADPATTSMESTVVNRAPGSGGCR
jgi:hypothetical protein